MSSANEWDPKNGKFPFMPSDDLNDEIDYEVEDTDTDIDTELAARLEEEELKRRQS
ncbi:hypothetical protein ACFVJ5_32135 [Nocardia sp. NPDC127606]|uniref:hypothetical protein n=1 Tax=Nocardia sp. NPDC127606 TaxID=3345406 RepID=UPI0036431A9F